MGYGLVPLVASIILAIHHVVFSDASRLSKVSIAMMVVASLVVWKYFPHWIVLATVLQIVTCIYVLLFQKFRDAT